MPHPHRSVTRRWLLAAAFLLAGCGSPTGIERTRGILPDDEIRRERRLGWIQFYHDPIAIQVPAEVTRAVDFEVTVRTYGGGCIGQGDTEVSVDGRTAEVRPYDIFVTHLPPNMACTADLRLYTHRATLRFNAAGVATVRIRGRTHPGDGVVVINRPVIVR